MRQRVRNNIRRESIVEYWRDEIENNESQVRIKPSWDDALTNCWACGNNFGGNLEKCHIIPHILGGEMDESNMFLMCQYCNKLNPETVFVEDFFKWVDGRQREGMVITTANPMGYDKEHHMMYGYIFSEMMEICLKQEEHKGIFHLQMMNNCFLRESIEYLNNNRDKYFTRYPATMAVALHNFFPIWDARHMIDGEFMLAGPLNRNLNGNVLIANEV